VIDELPQITDLRPYTMSVDAALAKNQRDIESGRRFPDERRLIRHHHGKHYLKPLKCSLVLSLLAL